MGRRVLGFVGPLSLVALAISLILWVKSYAAPDGTDVERRTTVWSISLGKGILALGSRRGIAAFGAAAWPSLVNDAQPASKRPWHQVGFAFERVNRAGTRAPVTGWAATVPCWSLALISSLLPLAWLVEWRARRRMEEQRRDGHCPQCGYDLQSLDRRCPECGWRFVRLGESKAERQ